MVGVDKTEELKAQVDAALTQKKPLEIRGGDSKRFYGRQPELELTPLEIHSHQGIVNFAPTELIMTARAGTRIREINQALHEQGQHLAFEPPEFHGTATLGGTLATGFSGPARPWGGGARDHMLGVRLLNGRGQVLRFGGEVIKNVAGYDVSRLMVGAMGTLGVILEASFKVMPKPTTEKTVVRPMDRQQGLEFMEGLGAKPSPLRGAVHLDGNVYLRLCGSETNVQTAIQELGGDVLPPESSFWHDLREFSHPFFETPLPIWRIVLPTGARPSLPGEIMADWSGGQWWVCSDAPPEKIRGPVSEVSGHAIMFRGGDRTGDVFPPLPPPMASLQARIRAAFDPEEIFNPGKISPTRNGI